MKAKIFPLLAALFYLSWMCGILSDLLISFQLFEPKGLVLKEIFAQTDLTAGLLLFAPAITLKLISYPLLLISIVFYLIFIKPQLKKEGWLLIILLLIIITAPFNIYLLFKDYRLLMEIINLRPAAETIALIRERFIVLDGFPLINLFVYLGMLFIAIIKPLQKTT
ncbi:hypothetical protein MROS_2509 [Melioribacter roseus P3M-2]|uniref:Uncharacterized protein n=1 Tax=Melioribacter roseus (strain DSM 23840 / JCM 17771 / VKM B-2668 / P3M-2) TaxID=1191523 RepID=I6ZUP6_MELRP|nr:hypothetical protein [Melioribacter roseus]AFN75739.1 hypothetical protein MROS_2509 [Melioribacter roseus P3M-2]